MIIMISRGRSSAVVCLVTLLYRLLYTHLLNSRISICPIIVSSDVYDDQYKGLGWGECDWAQNKCPLDLGCVWNHTGFLFTTHHK